MSADVPAMPTRVGRYDVVLALRTDDRGAAYLARASGLGGFDRYVVLEIAAKAFQERDDFSKLAIDEATRVANLRHTNVVPVYDVGEDDAGVFLVTEYVPGASLADLASAPKDVALRIVVDALQGLHAAHEHADEDGRPFNLVHGDLAPSSIVAGTDGIARIADLPLARATRRAAKPLGDRFASPERVRGDELDRRTDVWSVGVLAWEILTGRTFAATDAGDPPRVKSAPGAEGIADEIDAAVAAALHSDRDARTPTCAAFAKELASAARAAGMFAEGERVAEHVKGVAAPDLAKRREKLKAPEGNEAAKEEKLPTMIGVTPASADLPALPDVPAAPLKVIDSPISMLALQVDLSQHRGDRANTGVLGAIEPPKSDEAKAEASDGEGEEVYRSPVAVGPSTRASTGRTFLSGPLAKHEKISLAAGGVLFVIALGIAIVRCASGPSNGSATSASPSASATLAAASGSAAARNGVLRVTANGTIEAVTIGERIVEVDPSTSTDVELTSAERGKTLHVSVTSEDGRVATATVDPGVRGIEVSFTDRDTLPPPPPPPSASVAEASGTNAGHATVPKEKRTWKKRGPRK
jgi:serine/threonine protein kinase